MPKVMGQVYVIFLSKKKKKKFMLSKTFFFFNSHKGQNRIPKKDLPLLKGTQ